MKQNQSAAQKKYDQMVTQKKAKWSNVLFKLFGYHIYEQGGGVYIQHGMYGNLLLAWASQWDAWPVTSCVEQVRAHLGESQQKVDTLLPKLLKEEKMANRTPAFERGREVATLLLPFLFIGVDPFKAMDMGALLAKWDDYEEEQYAYAKGFASVFYENRPDSEPTKELPTKTRREAEDIARKVEEGAPGY